MKKYTFILNFGYVESSRLAFLPFSSLGSYRDAKEALIDLASFLKEEYLINNGPKPKKCCTDSKQKDSEAAFCSKCGRAVKDEGFDSEEFSDWLKSMNDADCDSFSEFIEYSPDHRWVSEGLEGKPNQRFVYQAEWVIAAALGYPHRQDRTFDGICKERTEKKQESFSYY